PLNNCSNPGPGPCPQRPAPASPGARTLWFHSRRKSCPIRKTGPCSALLKAQSHRKTPSHSARNFRRKFESLPKTDPCDLLCLCPIIAAESSSGCRYKPAARKSQVLSHGTRIRRRQPTLIRMGNEVGVVIGTSVRLATN